MKTCPFCGAQLADDARFCLACAHSLNEKRIIPKAHRLSSRLLTLLTAVFLMLIFTLSACLLLQSSQSEPSDITVQAPSSDSTSRSPSTSQAPSFSFSSSSHSSSEIFSQESSQSLSFASTSSQSLSSSSTSSQSLSNSSTLAPWPSTSRPSQSVDPDFWGTKLFPITAPSDFESYTILLEKTNHWHDNYSFTGNNPEIAEDMGLISNKNVMAVGFKNPISDNRYYIPESVNGYTVVGLAIDEGRGAGYYTFRAYEITHYMKEIYCPPSCRALFQAFCECSALTDLYIAADSFYLAPYDLPAMYLYDDYCNGSPEEQDNFRRPITIHAQPDAWLEHAGMTIAEYMSDPNNEYKCDFEPWDPSTVY